MIIGCIHPIIARSPPDATMTLTKADLVQRIRERHQNLSKQQAIEAVEAFLRLSKNALCNGSDLLLTGFGKFILRDKNARIVRNPKTGVTLTLESRRVVTFKTSGVLKKILNDK